MLTKKTISTVALTHQGLVRERNEDRFLVVDSPGGVLLVLADGMGGTNAGEVAAGIAVSEANEYFFGTGGGDKAGGGLKAEGGAPDRVAAILKEAILHAHHSIRERALAESGLKGMGTTLILGWIAGGRLTIAWSGDSRCYHYRQAIGIRRLSKDHSYVQMLVDEGLLDAERAFDHPLGHIVTQCLGDAGIAPQPDTTCLFLEKDDLVIFCSDGLNAMLTDAEIESAVREKGRNLSRCAGILIKKANEAGGADNITLLLAKYR